MSIYDTYRVVITGEDGKDSPGNLWERDTALAIFASVLLSAAEAKQHALEHPGHTVRRESVTRTTYLLEPTDSAS